MAKLREASPHSGPIAPRPSAAPAPHPGAGRTALAYAALSLPWLVGADLLLGAGAGFSFLTGREVALYTAARGLVFVAASAAGLHALLRRRAAAQALAAAQLQAVTDAAPAGIAWTDPDGVIAHANPTFLRLLGLSAATARQARLDALLSARLPGLDGAALLPPSGAARTTLRLPPDEGSGEERETEIALTSTRVPLGGADPGWVLTAVDITEDRAFRRANAINTSALEMAADGITVADLRRRGAPIVYANRAFEEITLYRAAEVRGKNCRFLQGADRLQPQIATVRDAIDQRLPVTVTLRNYRKDGSMFWNELRLAPVFDDNRVATHYVAIMRDVTEARLAAERLERLAYADPLTGLANRTRFTEQLAALLAGQQADFILVAQIDIRRFHEINTSAGNEAGDALLTEVARRLGAAFPDGLVSRLSGDEFALALPMEEPFAAELLATRIRAALGERFLLPGASLDAFFAIGFTVAEAGASARAAIRQAGVAVADAKQAGFGETRRFDQATEATIRGRVRLTSEMQQAIESGDFLLHYQPRVHLATGAIVGAEALIRWQHPVFGLQPPDRFLPAAEQTGLILDIGEWGLRRAARFAAALNRARSLPLPLSVNLSRVHFRRRDLPRTLRRIVIESGIDPSWLTLDLTESIFADPTTEMLDTLHRLRDLGFGISIDDFGTGASSIRHLGTFPLTEIKVDRSFVAGIAENGYHRAVMESVLRIGAALDVAVTAEGVEVQPERMALLEMGCGFGQGYLFSPPLAEDAFARMAEAQVLLPAAPGEDRHFGRDAA